MIDVIDFSSEEKEKIRQALEDLISLFEERKQKFHVKRVRKSQWVGKWVNKWCSGDGTIYLQECDIGALYHEFIHGVQHYLNVDKKWKEALADAFRYYSRLSDAEWQDKRTDYCELSYDEIIKESGDVCWEKKYGWAASLVIKEVGLDATMDEFLDWMFQTRDYDQYFGTQRCKFFGTEQCEEQDEECWGIEPK